ncbi:U-scoloptoxin(18)-Er1a-like [Ixodes scapularis]|uniref:U-scoloptoxin(18)-Er1a-like n=1 Tax=Ixodes scapularis TaxID=6945 RepID=UPI001A9D030B|nr:U-scoloptoxin(18)-Er1a-like [Ixodes scapularis]
MKALSAALALTIVVTALVADVGAQYGDNDYRHDDAKCDVDGNGWDLQKPIYPGGNPPLPWGIGHTCGAYSECKDHLCCLRSYDGTTTCQPKSELGQWCSDEQVKGGVNINLCPCLKGTCREHICSL